MSEKANVEEWPAIRKAASTIAQSVASTAPGGGGQP
jgi:hypothetical protein